MSQDLFVAHQKRNTMVAGLRANWFLGPGH